MVEVREAALSDRAGERDFAHVVDAPGWSGFVARPVPAGGPVETTTVRCERLDDALPEDVDPAFVKVDVESAEEEVLLGAAETLQRHRPVGYRIYGLDGDGPYSAERFAEIYRRGERVNFLARPPV